MPTPTSSCPHCDGLSVWLESLSQATNVDYYRCSQCSMVWNVPKGQTGPMTVNVKGQAVAANKQRM